MKMMAAKLAMISLALVIAGCSSTSDEDGAVKPSSTLKGSAAGGLDDGRGGLDRTGATGNTLGGGGGGGGGGAAGRTNGAISDNDRRVYFDLNSSMINEQGRRTLTALSKSLSGSRAVIVEGHCDERGTREYNLALGQRRADSVKDFLTSQGVSGAAIRTISFGKEQPLVNGHDEGSWSQNRRAEVRSE